MAKIHKPLRRAFMSWTEGKRCVCRSGVTPGTSASRAALSKHANSSEGQPYHIINCNSYPCSKADSFSSKDDAKSGTVEALAVHSTMAIDAGNPRAPTFEGAPREDIKTCGLGQSQVSSRISVRSLLAFGHCIVDLPKLGLLETRALIQAKQLQNKHPHAVA